MRTGGLNPSEGARAKNLTLFSNTGVPANPEEGQVAFDSSTTPSTLWIYQNSAWERIETSANTGWTYVTDSPELVAALTAQKRNILVEIGTYSLTAAVAPYDDLTLLGLGNYLNDDGTAGVTIELNGNDTGGFVHAATKTSALALASAPVRGDLDMNLSAQIGSIYKAGDALVSYNLRGQSTGAPTHILGKTTQATDTALRMHNTFPWDTTLSYLTPPTTCQVHTDILKNFTIENIAFRDPSGYGSGNEAIDISGGINIKLKKIKNHSGTANGGILLKNVVGLKIEEVLGEFNDSNNAWTIKGCAEIDIKNCTKNPEVDILTAYWVHYILNCYNLNVDDIRGSNIWINYSTQFEINNYHREYDNADGDDFHHNSFFAYTNSSIGNIAEDTYDDVFGISTCQYFKLDNIHVRSTLTGTKHAFQVTNSDNYSVLNCSAPNADADLKIVHGGSTNYREFGNDWQGNVVHEGIATSAGSAFLGTKFEATFTITAPDYNTHMLGGVVTVNGVPFTGVASAPTADEFIVSPTSMWTTFANLRDAINAHVHANLTNITATAYNKASVFLSCVWDIEGASPSFTITADYGSTYYETYYVLGSDAVSQGAHGIHSYVIGRDSGVSASSEDSMVISSPDSYISSAYDGTVIVGGIGNTIAGDTYSSAIIGGTGNRITTDGETTNVIIAGEDNWIGGGSYCAMLGGYSHWQWGVPYIDVYVGGSDNYNGSTYGYNVFVGAERCWQGEDAYNNIIFQQRHLVNGEYKFIHGSYGEAVNDHSDMYYKYIHARGGSTIKAQFGRLIRNVATTSATPSTIKFFDVNDISPSSNKLATCVYAFNIKMTAIQYATGGAGAIGDCCVKYYKGVIKNVGGTVSLVGNITETIVAYDTDALDFALIIAANDSTKSLDVQCQGELNKSIEFMYSIETEECGR